MAKHPLPLTPDEQKWLDESEGRSATTTPGLEISTPETRAIALQCAVKICVGFAGDGQLDLNDTEAIADRFDRYIVLGDNRP